MNKREKRMHKRNKTGAYAPYARFARRYVWTAMILLVVTIGYTTNLQSENIPEIVSQRTSEVLSIEYLSTLDVISGVEKPYKTTQAHVTGFNTVEAQTDETPCISASGHDICGRSDVVACPRHLPLGTKVEIDGKMYECLDRTAPKYNDRFDISCDKDFACPARVTGEKEVRIYE